LVAKHLSFDAARLPTPGRASHISLHDLRHTAATLAVAAGESVLFVQSMLGHSDVRTTMRYAHPDHEAHRAAAARVAAFRKSGATGLLRVEGLLGRQ